MKKFVSMLLVLTVILAMASTAFAADCLVKSMVMLKCDSNAYTAAKSSAKTGSVAAKYSIGYCVKVCGKYAKVLVNDAGDGTYAWFKKADLKAIGSNNIVYFKWVKGGKGYSRYMHGTMHAVPSWMKGLYIKVSAHTNLRKTPSLHHKSQATVEKCTLLKIADRYGFDDRGVQWIEVCYKGKKLWVSTNFVMVDSHGVIKFFDKDGNRI